MLIDHVALFSAVPTPCLIMHADFRICEVNPAYLRATGRTREALIGRDVLEAFPDNPADPAATGTRNLRASLERVLATGQPDIMPLERYDLLVGEAFEERWWRVVNTPVADDGGRVALIVNSVEDVTDAQRVRLELERSERRFRSLVEHAQDAIVVIGADHQVTYASPATRRFIGRRLGGLEAHPWTAFVHPDDVATAVELLEQAQAAGPGESRSGRLRVAQADGALRFVDVHATDHRDDDAIHGMVINVRDVTDRHLIETTLQQQALEDALTGTPNRRWFLEAAKAATARTARSGKPLSVVLIDVDHFKLVNDTMGHPGDRLLVELAQRMAGALRPSDTVARLGGDEFAILSEDLRTEQDAWLIAQRIAEAATGLYELGRGLEARVTLSIGVSTDEGGADADTLLAHADAALYKAKRRGRNRIEVFDPELRSALVHRLQVENDLRRALEHDELVLHWQPIIRTSDRAVVGAEALLRWQHPERGLLAPGHFLPVAEEAGLMRPIGTWAVDRALAQAAVWQRGGDGPRVFINLAAEQIRVPSLPEDVARLAATHGVQPGEVCFEVSERMLDADLSALREQLCRLRALGFGLALDDFGAGNTALSWLQELPLDVLKLDRRFTATVEDTTAQAIIRAIVDLGPQLGMTSIAEGVETPGQLETLRRLGCDFAQGYEIAEPQSARRVSQRFRRDVQTEAPR